MTTSLRSPALLGWLVLVVATVASYVVGTDHGIQDRNLVAAVLLAIAFAKVFIVGRNFMELHAAAPWLRNAFTAYVLLVGATLATLALVL